MDDKHGCETHTGTSDGVLNSGEASGSKKHTQMQIRGERRRRWTLSDGDDNRMLISRTYPLKEGAGSKT